MIGETSRHKEGYIGDVMKLRAKIRFECPPISVIRLQRVCRPAIERSSFLGISVIIDEYPDLTDAASLYRQIYGLIY